MYYYTKVIWSLCVELFVPVTTVQYGTARAIKVKDAFNQTVPTKYQKGAGNLTVGSATGDLNTIRTAALTTVGKDDDNGTRRTRSTNRPSAPPSVSTTARFGPSRLRPRQQP